MLYYITSNKNKVRVAQKYLNPFNIHIEGKELDLYEIQSEDITEIAISKAKQAYAILKKPLFVNDAGWYITALRGFPGPFMKYMNDWLTSDDFLNLMSRYTNREVIFKEVICYIDKDQVKPFIGEIKGEVLEENTDDGEQASRAVISLSSSRKSIARCWKDGVPPVDDYKVWGNFAHWYNKKTNGYVAGSQST